MYYSRSGSRKRFSNVFLIKCSVSSNVILEPQLKSRIEFFLASISCGLHSIILYILLCGYFKSHSRIVQRTSVVFVRKSFNPMENSYLEIIVICQVE